MAKIFYVHWNKDEGLEIVEKLRAAGHSIVFHYSTDEAGAKNVWQEIKLSPPDVVAISLARLPSHGRRIASVLGEMRKFRELPLLFVDGEEDKIETARQQFPSAVFTTNQRLPATLASVLSKT